MADFGGLSGLSAASPGFQAAQGQFLSQQAQQINNQNAMDDRAGLVALGNALGVAPPNAPQTQAPGQPSQPTPGPAAQSQGQGGQSQGGQGGQSQGGQGGQSQGGQGGQSQGGQGAQGRQANPNAPVQPGQMTLQDLTARIIALNPGIQKRPDILVRALSQGQKLLAPDEKVLLDQQKTQMAFDTQMAKIQQQSDAAVQRASSAQQVAEIRAASAQAVADLANQRAVTVASIAQQGKQTSSQAVDRRQLVAAATKAGVPVKADMSDDQIQNLTAAKTAGDAGGALTPGAANFFAEALRNGDNATVQMAMGFQKNRAQIMAQVIAAAQAQDPSFTGQKAASALAQFGGEKAAANTVGRTAGNVAIGAAEIPQFVPKIEALTKKLNLSEFPTVNAVTNATRKGTGNGDVVQLNSYIQSLKNAYQQVMARGGRMTDQQRKYASELIDGSMPLNQIVAAANAMKTEAGVAGSATGQAMKDVTGQGDSDSSASATPSDDSSGEDDPLGLLK